ncbi:hypothetical protein KCU62_g344, partial [Aureobasidium sp. EXF-3399]
LEYYLVQFLFCILDSQDAAPDATGVLAARYPNTTAVRHARHQQGSMLDLCLPCCPILFLDLLVSQRGTPD